MNYAPPTRCSPADVAEILAFAAGVDNRNVTEDAARIWHTILAPYSQPELARAVREHFRSTTERLYPAHLVRLVRRERSEGLAYPDSSPPHATEELSS